MSIAPVSARLPSVAPPSGPSNPKLHQLAASGQPATLRFGPRTTTLTHAQLVQVDGATNRISALASILEPQFGASSPAHAARALRAIEQANLSARPIVVVAIAMPAPAPKPATPAPNKVATPPAQSPGWLARASDTVLGWCRAVGSTIRRAWSSLSGNLH